MTFHPVLPTDTTQPVQITPSGDTTGATDLAHIKTALASTGVAVLAKGAFTINGAITLTSGQSLAGAGAQLTTITQTSTTANGISIVDTATLNDNSVTGVTLTGPGQGTGTGTGIFVSSNSGAGSVFRLNLAGIHVQNWGVDGVSATNLFISTVSRVRSETNGRRGFFFATGTTLTATNCAAVSNTERGWYLTNMEATSLLSCGGDTNAIGYELHQCQVVALHACDAVSNAAGGGGDGTGFKLTGGNNNSLRNCFVSGNNAVAFWATSSEFDSTFDCCWETSPGGSATASIKADVQVTLINPNVVTAMNLTSLFTEVTATESFFNIAHAGNFQSSLTGGGKISSGSGAPSNPFGSGTTAGDIYFRTDTPGTVNQRIYICTVGSPTNTWVGIL